MNLDLHLIHTCDTSRASKTDDRYRNKSIAYSPHLTAQRCRLIEKSERVINSITAELLIRTAYTLLVPLNVDIQPTDRITSLTLEDGRVLEQVFEVQSSMRGNAIYATARMLSLEKVL